jgi:radical SAM superfamily enzyme YgiQ (UPF0313 family)
MLRIGFVLHPDTKNFKPFKFQPLTSLYLLTILEEKFGNKLDLSLIDLRGISEENVRYYVPEMDVYLYSALTPEYSSVCQVRDLIRLIYPKSLHIAGGVHINLYPEESAKEFDAIALGEGEETIVQIIKDIFAGCLKPVYKSSQVVDLNQYPYPSRKHLPLHAVVDAELLHGDDVHLIGANVLFSRGCPFRCSFCANLNFGPTRFREPILIEEEIEYLKKEYGVEALVLRDDNAIPVNKKIAKPFKLLDVLE